MHGPCRRNEQPVAPDHILHPLCKDLSCTSMHPCASLHSRNVHHSCDVTQRSLGAWGKICDHLSCTFIQKCTIKHNRVVSSYRSGAWEKQHGGDDERKRLLTQTRDSLTKGLQSDHEWHTVSHADYARPMLQVMCWPHMLYAIC